MCGADTAELLQAEANLRRIISGMGVGLVLVNLGWLTIAVFLERDEQFLGHSWLKVAPKQLDFGDVWMRDRFEWPITFANETRSPVVVDTIRTSCSCTTVRPNRFVVATGQT
jgi:hypothetical protein